MIRVFRFACVCALAALLAQTAAAQESKSAKTTREKLKQKASVDAKEQGTKSIFDELLGEAEKPIRFKIDNVSGISNNTKLTFKGKGTIEEILNQMSDKFDFGWYVVSEEGNNKIDGMVIIRKNTDGKERGKKFDKKKTSAPPPAERMLPRQYTLDAAPILTRSPATLRARLRD